MRPSVLLPCLSVLLLAGCATPFRRHDNRADGTGVARKLVVEKREKSMLVAFDRTVCMVDAKRYREVQVRDAVWCNWRHDGGEEVTTVAPGGSIVSNAKPPVEEAVAPRPPKRTARPRKATAPADAKKPADKPAEKPAKRDD
jgi:hypothetical protein